MTVAAHVKVLDQVEVEIGGIYLLYHRDIIHFNEEATAVIRRYCCCRQASLILNHHSILCFLLLLALDRNKIEHVHIDSRQVHEPGVFVQLPYGLNRLFQASQIGRVHRQNVTLTVRTILEGFVTHRAAVDYVAVLHVRFGRRLGREALTAQGAGVEGRHCVLAEDVLAQVVLVEEIPGAVLALERLKVHALGGRLSDGDW